MRVRMSPRTIELRIRSSSSAELSSRGAAKVSPMPSALAPGGRAERSLRREPGKGKWRGGGAGGGEEGGRGGGRARRHKRRVDRGRQVAHDGRVGRLRNVDAARQALCELMSELIGKDC